VEVPGFSTTTVTNHTGEYINSGTFMINVEYLLNYNFIKNGGGALKQRNSISLLLIVSAVCKSSSKMS